MLKGVFLFSLFFFFYFAERPLAEIVLLTGWSEVFHTDSLVLSCEVTAELAEEGTRWNYTW